MHTSAKYKKKKKLFEKWFPVFRLCGYVLTHAQQISKINLCHIIYTI